MRPLANLNARRLPIETTFKREFDTPVEEMFGRRTNVARMDEYFDPNSGDRWLVFRVRDVNDEAVLVFEGRDSFLAFAASITQAAADMTRGKV